MKLVIPSSHARALAPVAAAVVLQARWPGTPAPRTLAGESATGRILGQAQSSLALASLQAAEAARIAAARLATYKQAAARYQYATEFAASTQRKALAAQANYEQLSVPTGAMSTHARRAFTTCKQAWQAASRATSDAQIAGQHYRDAYLQAIQTTTASRCAAAAEIAAAAACNHALAADEATTLVRPCTQLPYSRSPRLSGYPALESEVARSQAFRRSLSSRLSAAG